MTPVLARDLGWGNYCPNGFASIEIGQLSGCLETAARTTPAAFSQGVIRYTCYRQTKQQTVGLTLSGTYSQGCKLPAAISLPPPPL